MNCLSNKPINIHSDAFFRIVMAFFNRSNGDKILTMNRFELTKIELKKIIKMKIELTDKDFLILDIIILNKTPVFKQLVLAFYNDNNFDKNLTMIKFKICIYDLEYILFSQNHF